MRWRQCSQPLASVGRGAENQSPIAASIQDWLLVRRRMLRSEASMKILRTETGTGSRGFESTPDWDLKTINSA